MIPYHGVPITPDPVALRVLKNRHAFVSYAHPQQLGLVLEVCRSAAFDNGAFPLWKSGRPTNWPGYYAWIESIRREPVFDFAVIPDVIGGTENENDALLREWPFDRHEGAPVWHVNESIDRLVRLAFEYPRVCLGSSGEYDVSRKAAFLRRMREVLPYICDGAGRPITKLHGLRMLNPTIYSQIPLSSGDSTNMARNIGIDAAWRGTYQPASKETRALVLAERIESGVPCRALPGGGLL